jgi:hypothetical protein
MQELTVQPTSAFTRSRMARVRSPFTLPTSS